jgi:hypothetical protein
LFPVDAIPEEGVWVADLRISIPIDKGWVAQQEVLPGFTDDAARRRFAERLAWLASRPALDDRFVTTVVAPLVKSLQTVKKKNSELFERLSDQVLELCLRTDDTLAMSMVEVIALSATEVDTDVDSWLKECWEAWFPAATAVGLQLLPLRIASLGDVRASEYRLWTRIPLNNLSPNLLVWGPDDG